MRPTGTGAGRSHARQLAVVAAAAVGLVSLAACASHTSGSGTPSGSATSSASSPSPTPTDTSQSPSTSADSLTPSSSPTTSASSSGTIQQTNLVITRSGWDPVAHQVAAVAILPGQVITTGTCVLTIKQGTVTRTATKASTPDASSTDCGQLAITDPTLAAGTWTGSVSFTGGGVSAISGTFTFDVTH